MDDMTELARAVASLRIRERQALGAMLKVWRLRATMTQTKVAEVTGLRRDRVSMVEGGRVAIPPELVARIADVVGGSCAPAGEVHAAMQRVGGGL